MRIRLAIPDRHVTAPVLDAALEATTRAAQSQMAAGEAPTFTDLLRSGVKWQPERFADGEHFDLPAVMGERGWGDCDDWAPTLAAELRATGADPGARARVVRSGRDRWHAIVQMSDGQIVDPSRMAGMKGPSTIVGSSITRPMAKLDESAIALAQRDGRWWARTDVPWSAAHIVSLASDRHAANALDRSICGALAVGKCVGWAHAADRSVLGELFQDAASGSPRHPIWTAYRDGPIVARF